MAKKPAARKPKAKMRGPKKPHKKAMKKTKACGQAVSKFEYPDANFEPCELPEGLTPEQVCFLRKFECTNNISRSAACARVHRDTVYEWRKQDKFKRAFQDVRESMLDNAEQLLAWAGRVEWKAALKYLERERPVGTDVELPEITLVFEEQPSTVQR